MKRFHLARLGNLWNRMRGQTTDGQILVMFAAGIVFLLGMVAVAVDTGFLMAERRQVQSAADAGALAAAKAKLDYMYQAAPGDLESAQVQAGEEYASRNAGVAPGDVVVDTAPDGYGDEFVEVTVSKDVDMFFIRALYDGDWGTSASAIAGIDDIQLPYALVALNCPGIHVSGSGTIDVNEGSIMSNCNITRDGDSSIVTSDGVIDANGNIDEGTNWYAGQGYREGRPPLDDPIASSGILPPSKTEAQDLRSVTTSAELQSAVSAIQSDGRCPNGSTCVMQPGFYGGGLTIDVRNNAILQMQPGIYYFDDGFTLRGRGGGTIRGDDIMIYIAETTSTTKFNPDNAIIEISAPESSPYPGGLDGMALWIANCSEFRKKAENSGIFDGVIYAPCSTVELSGSPGAQGMQVIVGRLELSGGGSFNILYEEYVLFDMPGVFLVR
jgi:hypothetical protein